MAGSALTLTQRNEKHQLVRHSPKQFQLHALCVYDMFSSHGTLLVLVLIGKPPMLTLPKMNVSEEWVDKTAWITGHSYHCCTKNSFSLFEFSTKWFLWISTTALEGDPAKLRRQRNREIAEVSAVGVWAPRAWLKRSRRRTVLELTSIDWFWLPIFPTNLVRGLSNKEMSSLKRWAICTARSVEDKTRNGDRNAKRILIGVIKLLF